MECLQLTPTALAALLAAGWTQVNGPHVNLPDCLNQCGGSSNSSASINPPCANCIPVGLGVEVYLPGSGTGIFATPYTGIMTKESECVYSQTASPPNGTVTRLTITSNSTAVLDLIRGTGRAVYTFSNFYCDNQNGSDSMTLINPFPGGDVPPSGVLAGPPV